MAENERKNLVNNLSDAIKECQLRFGGKRELATELDGRVCILCAKLEAIFTYGLKNQNNKQSGFALSNTLQLNSLINLKSNPLIKSTGNLISQFFDETKANLPLPISSNKKQNEFETQNELSFWPFIKNFINKFDIERFELLAHIKTDTGRQRSWLRNCLNEHTLERYTIAVLNNEELIKTYYEDWCLLLDKSYNQTLPILISGLQSILFAINIDNSNLNIPSKLVTSEPIKIRQSSHSVLVNSSNNNVDNQPALKLSSSFVDTTSTAPKIKKIANQSSIVTNSQRKVKKNNVVVFDNESNENILNNNNKKVLSSVNNRSKSSAPNFRTNTLETIDYSQEDEENEDELGVVFNDDKQNENNILNNQASSLSSNNNSMKSANSFKDDLNNKVNNVNNINNNNNSDNSGDSSTERINDMFNFSSNCNLIPVTNNEFNGINSADTVSVYSNQSETSNDVVLNNANTKYEEQHSPSDVFAVGGYSNFNAISMANTSKSPDIPYSRSSTSLKNKTTSSTSTPIGSGATSSTLTTSKLTINEKTENLSLNELREVVLTMIQRKDQMEEVNKNLKDSLEIERSVNKGLEEKVLMLEKESFNTKELFQNKLQSLENENRLLKDQLKKYVSAVQMIRPNNASNDEDKTLSPTRTTSVIPPINPNLQRDYSYEAEQYEQKLIQVAEMHGELMEFNSRLHKIINFRNSQIAKLKEELVQLRGPLPNDSSYELLEDSHAIESETESLSNLNSPLINIWIPSAFLRSDKSGSHHVYQIYIRIKNEEWNIFRRFSHFYNLNSKLKQKYPIITTINFPKKKAIGNKDSKFVEARRQLLQDYLRQLVNTVSKIDRDLSLKPCRETLIRAIPFLGDQVYNPMIGPHVLPNGSSVPIRNNSLSNMIRNNTISNMLSATPVDIAGINNTASASPIINNSLRTNELLYTGL